MDSIDFLAQRLEKVNNYPMLLLGAGFSLGAISDTDKPLKLGKDVTNDLYNVVLIPHLSNLTNEEKEDCQFYLKRGRLLDICNIIHRHNLDNERNIYICKSMSGCRPKIVDETSRDYIDFNALTTYPWPFIFTLNVDDLVENIFKNAHKDYELWTRNSKRLMVNPRGTTIVKMHGCVNFDKEHFVFCQDEYNDFIRVENPLLNRFGDESFSRDVIVVGTQFQENDLKNVINTMISRRCSGMESHYFFIHPGSEDIDLKNSINMFSHYHHISWTNKDFLAFLRKRIRIENIKKDLLTRNFFTLWNDELEESRMQDKDDHSLYYGRTPKASDFFYLYDIGRIDKNNKVVVADDFKNNISDKDHTLYIVKGNTYVGKTCLALRLLTICTEEGFTCYYTRKSDYEAIQRLKEYINNTIPEEKMAVCLEDPSGCYHALYDLIKQGERLKRFVLIAVTDEKEHQTKSHNLIKIPNITEYTISERLNKKSIQLMYSKLSDKKQLGELQREGTASRIIKLHIKNIGDFMDVLYFAHHGQSFLEHFQNWYCSKDDEYSDVFNALVVYASLGVKWFSPILFCDVANSINSKFKYDSFIAEYKDYVIVEDGRIRLHGTRMFSEIIKKNVSKPIINENIIILMRILGKRLHERDNNELSIMYENIAKSKHLNKEFGIKPKENIQLLKKTENECGHLSYYWIQLSILYREEKKFEDAANAILYAQNVRGYRTYQIAHADAKNYMVWGVERAKAHDSSANELFEKGRDILENLITNNKYYRDAFGFSVHTYVNMMIQYHKNSNETISVSDWFYIIQILNDYVKQANYQESIMVNLYKQVNIYAKNNGFNSRITRELIHELSTKPYKSSISFEVDEMPDNKVIL